MKTQLIKRQFTRYVLICFFALIAGANAQAQIANPDFETYTTCPTAGNQISYATSWNGVGPVLPYYFNTCGYMPSKATGWANTVLPQSGNGLSAIILENGANDFKQYLVNTLSAPLVAGTTYTMTFYVRFGDGVEGASGPGTEVDLLAAERGYFGLAFSATAPTVANRDTSTHFMGGIVNTFPAAGTGAKTLIPASNAVYISHTFVPVTLQYTAVGGEKYMTVGQFRPGVSADPSGFNSVVAYIDNFTMTAATCKAGGSTVTFTANTSLGDPANTTSYILTDVAGVILNTSISPSGFTAPATAGTYNIYSVNYSGTLTGNTAGSNISGVTSSTGCAVKTPASFCVTAACIATSVPITVN